MTPTIYAHLSAADPVLAALIQQGYAEQLKPTAHEDLYLELLDAIIGQQLSVKAAATISARFTALFPQEYPMPERVLALTLDELRAVGVSRQKAGYLQSVAAFKQAGQMEYDVLSQLSDDALAEHLTQIKGVGRWTAQMLLMFALERPDVFPELDLGVQNAMRKHYGLTETGKPLLRRMTEIADAWRPYRTTASRLLWKSLNNMPAGS
jgi:DNA-3-methyladenine glycosylase II